MKTNIALLVAVGMGIVGGFLNLLYLSDSAAESERVAFLGIKPELTVRRGDTFKKDHFAPVYIPKKNVGKGFSLNAEPWTNLENVVDTRANRDYEGGEIILRDQLKTPPTELKPGPDEDVLFVPVDTRSFVPSLLNPGEYVSFLIPITALAPNPAAQSKSSAEKDNPDEDPDAAPTEKMIAVQTGVEKIGPFRVLAIGNRLGAYDVWKSHGLSQQQENVLTVAVNTKDGQLDRDARRLWKLLQQSASRQAGVVKDKPAGKSKVASSS